MQSLFNSCCCLKYVSVSHECVASRTCESENIYEISLFFKVSLIFLKTHNPGKSIRQILLEDEIVHNSTLPPPPHDHRHNNIQLVVNNDIVNDEHYQDYNEHVYDYHYGEIRKE